METFYGEPILENLLKHTKGINKQLRSFRSYYEDIELEEEEEEELGEENEDGVTTVAQFSR